MKRVTLARSAVAAMLILGPSLVLACGELRFNSGKGLPFQNYLAPRPAEVLILTNAAGADAVPAGLERAGHHVTVVPDVGAMRTALMTRHFDIVIAPYDASDAVTANVDNPNVDNPSGGLTKLLPVVARSARNSSALRERFEEFVVDGASLGQFLTVINRLLPR